MASFIHMASLQLSNDFITAVKWLQSIIWFHYATVKWFHSMIWLYYNSQMASLQPSNGFIQSYGFITTVKWLHYNCKMASLQLLNDFIHSYGFFTTFKWLHYSCQIDSWQQWNGLNKPKVQIEEIMENPLTDAGYHFVISIIIVIGSRGELEIS